MELVCIEIRLKKISAAGVTPKLRVTAMTWTERSLLKKGYNLPDLVRLPGGRPGKPLRGEILQQKFFFSLELEGKRKPQTSMQR